MKVISTLFNNAMVLSNIGERFSLQAREKELSYLNVTTNCLLLLLMSLTLYVIHTHGLRTQRRYIRPKLTWYHISTSNWLCTDMESRWERCRKDC